MVRIFLFSLTGKSCNLMWITYLEVFWEYEIWKSIIDYVEFLDRVWLFKMQLLTHLGPSLSEDGYQEYKMQFEHMNMQMTNDETEKHTHSLEYPLSFQIYRKSLVRNSVQGSKLQTQATMNNKVDCIFW